MTQASQSFCEVAILPCHSKANIGNATQPNTMWHQMNRPENHSVSSGGRTFLLNFFLKKAKVKMYSYNMTEILFLLCP